MMLIVMMLVIATLFLVGAILLGIGSWRVEESAYAKSVTLVKTTDNKYRFGAVTYTDDKVCYFEKSHINDKYIFNTEADALENWNARNPPFQANRYEERWRIMPNCYNFDVETYLDVASIIIIVTFCLAFIIMSFGSYVRYKIYHNQVLPVRQREPPLITQKEKKEEKGLSIYAATCIAEAHIHRKEICPVTQEPLDKVALLVPECGHILSESAVPGKIPETCCVCREKVHYTRVEGKLLITKPEENQV